jgi:hypothetical protein
MIMKKSATKNSGQRNIWKIVSVVFIALFILILAWGVFGLRQKPNFTAPTEDQIDLAKTVVAEDLHTMGDSIDNYEVFVTNRIVGFIGKSHQRNGMHGMKPLGCPNMMGCSGRNIQVALKGNSSGYLYIVDMDSGKISMKSFTEWFNV